MAQPSNPDPIDTSPAVLLAAATRAQTTAKAYVDLVDWLALFGDCGIDRERYLKDIGYETPPEEIDPKGVFPLLPIVTRPAWENMLEWSERNLKGDFHPWEAARNSPLACLFGTMREAFVRIEALLRDLAKWTKGVPFEWFDRIRLFDGRVVIDQETGREFPTEHYGGKTVAILGNRTSTEEIVGRLRCEYDAFDIAVGTVLRELERQMEKPVAGLSGWVSVADIAKHYGMGKKTKGSLGKRLGRWKDCHSQGAGWKEVQDRRRNADKYLYRAKAIQSIVDDLLSKRDLQKPGA